MLQYYFAGSDGSGKSTYIELLKKYLDEKNITSQYIWIRSPKITSKPLMLYCRIIGYTKYRYINNIKYGVHEFYRSKFVSFFFPILQLLDFYLKDFMIQRKLKKKKVDVILYDRHAIDTLVDLMVDTHRFNLHKQLVGRLFIKLLPENAKILVLRVKEQIIRNRKIDTLFDVNLSNKIKAYDILSKDLGFDVIYNDDNDPAIVFSKIKNTLNLQN